MAGWIADCSMTERMEAATFQVWLPGEAAEDVFGLWQVQTGVDLGTGLGDEIGSVWRAALPEDLQEGGVWLDEHASRLAASRRALPAAAARLEADLASLPGPRAAAFSTDASWSAAGPDSPRGVLIACAQYRWAAGEASFGFLDTFKLELPQVEAIGELVRRFAGQVRSSVEQSALVQTEIGGRPEATTRVAWSGDVETWWAAGRARDSTTQHLRVLTGALALRQEWLRFLLQVTSGAARTAAALATGPFSLLALWTTWNYIKAVVNEYQELQSLRRNP
jgi:hypothetical protein